jgi:4-alpha-glucanotransferase
LLHPTSLPGPFETGDLGPAAHAAVDFIAAAGFGIWQMLPLGPVGPGNSPYSSTSVFAGSPGLVSLEHLAEDGLLDASDPVLAPAEPGARCDFGRAAERRRAALSRAFERAKGRADIRAATEAFGERHAYWLRDFALFSTLKDLFGGASHHDWPAPLRRREASAIASVAKDHADAIAFHEFVQWRFALDVERLRAKALGAGVRLMGDAPIYVAEDSVEVWAHPELFLRDPSGELASVAGVPPDAFSDDGQLWGNPLYDWDYMQKTGFGFWVARIEHALRSFDAIRLDHFIGFSRYYAIARGEKSAKRGTYHPVPGHALFATLGRVLGPIPLVAEDLGVVTEEVKRLRDDFGFPGMGVLEFSFSPDPGAESSRPHRYPINSVVYTGTHDNDTAAGWFGGPPDDASTDSRARYERERAFAIAYFGLDPAGSPAELAWGFVREALKSHAVLAIVPMQDLLGQGREARMNRPGIAEGNWGYRLLPGQASAELAARVRALVELYGRRRA